MVGSIFTKFLQYTDSELHRTYKDKMFTFYAAYVP